MTATDVRTEFVELSHGPTRYYEAGSGPAVVLVHGAGFLSGAHTWLPVFPHLAEHFHLYAIDCLGFGLTDGLEQGYSFAYLVDHIREFQDAIGLDHSHVIGHSMGGWLGTLLAYESPDRVDRYVNISGGGTATRPLTGMVNWTPPDDDAIRTAIARLTGTEVDLDELAAALIARAHDEASTGRFRRLMDHMTNPETRNRYNTQRRMPHITAPTLVLWGSNDQTNALEMGEKTHDLIPGSKLTVFDGAGHGLPQERPLEFSQEVIGFLS
jgi:pimeloyl-ACP methyl ester carboxylesterase